MIVKKPKPRRNLKALLITGLTMAMGGCSLLDGDDTSGQASQPQQIESGDYLTMEGVGIDSLSMSKGSVKIEYQEDRADYYLISKPDREMHIRSGTLAETFAVNSDFTVKCYEQDSASEYNEGDFCLGFLNLPGGELTMGLNIGVYEIIRLGEPSKHYHGNYQQIYGEFNETLTLKDGEFTAASTIKGEYQRSGEYTPYSTEQLSAQPESLSQNRQAMFDYVRSHGLYRLGTGQIMFWQLDDPLITLDVEDDWFIVERQ